MNYSAIPQRYLSTALPFASGTSYQILFQNSTDPSNIAGPGLLTVASGGSINCLLLNGPMNSGRPAGGRSKNGSQPTNSNQPMETIGSNPKDGSNPNSNNPTDSNNGSGSTHPNVGAIVGGVVGGTVILLLLRGCVSLFLLRRRKTRSSPDPETSYSHLNPPASATTAPTSSTPSTPANADFSGNGNGVDRFRNPFKPSTSHPTTSATASLVSLMTGYDSSDTPAPETEPIYHQDAGRVEVPPSYSEAGSESRAILELVSR